MMLIDGAPRLSLMRKRGDSGNSANTNNSSSSSSNSNSMRMLMRQKKKGNKNNNNNKNNIKKCVRFDMTQKTCVRSIPRASNEDAEHLWHSNLDYSFFILNWKYYPHEPMEPRSFLDTLWQIKHTPETMRMEDYQCFQPQEQDNRNKIRLDLLQAYEDAPIRRVDALSQRSISMTAEHRRQAQVCGALNAKEVQEYLRSSPKILLTRDEVMHEAPSSAPSKSSNNNCEQQQTDAMTFLSDYVDSIIHRTAALWPTQ